jgi:hypothetical protein
MVFHWPLWSRVAKVAKRGREQNGSVAIANKRDGFAVKPCCSNQRAHFENDATQDCFYRKFRTLVHSFRAPRFYGASYQGRSACC